MPQPQIGEEGIVCVKVVDVRPDGRPVVAIQADGASIEGLEPGEEWVGATVPPDCFFKLPPWIFGSWPTRGGKRISAGGGG